MDPLLVSILVLLLAVFILVQCGGNGLHSKHRRLMRMLSTENDEPSSSQPRNGSNNASNEINDQRRKHDRPNINQEEWHQQRAQNQRERLQREEERANQWLRDRHQENMDRERAQNEHRERMEALRIQADQQRQLDLLNDSLRRLQQEMNTRTREWDRERVEREEVARTKRERWTLHEQRIRTRNDQHEARRAHHRLEDQKRAEQAEREGKQEAEWKERERRVQREHSLAQQALSNLRANLDHQASWQREQVHHAERVRRTQQLSQIDLNNRHRSAQEQEQFNQIMTGLTELVANPEFVRNLLQLGLAVYSGGPL